MTSAADLLRLIHGYRISQAIHVAVRIGLPDQLGAEPRGNAELAATLDCDAGALQRLLHALATVGLAAEQPDGRFAATALGDELRSDAASRLGLLAAFVGRPYTWQAWSELEHTVRTGENAFETVHGTSVWEYRRRHPEEGVAFDGAMLAMSRRVAGAILDAYDFGPFDVICDVAGGTGAMLAAVLRRHPRARGILLDQPHVVAGAAAVLDDVTDRCEVVPGDIFATIPGGADAYLLKAILHDWADEQCVEILRATRHAMAPGSVLLVLERVLAGPPYTADSDMIAFSDLNMMVGPGGRERTADQYGALFAQAGLALSRVVPTATDVSVIEALTV